MTWESRRNDSQSRKIMCCRVYTKHLNIWAKLVNRVLPRATKPWDGRTASITMILMRIYAALTKELVKVHELRRWECNHVLWTCVRIMHNIQMRTLIILVHNRLGNDVGYMDTRNEMQFSLTAWLRMTCQSSGTGIMQLARLSLITRWICSLCSQISKWSISCLGRVWW